jgi:cob(I)alamin adenosyltransferase
MSSSIATRTGDDGTTGMLFGQRVAKDHPQIEAVGAFDELNVAVGFAKAFCSDATRRHELESIQSDLINLMGELACAQSDAERYIESNFVKLTESDLARLDAMLADLESRNLTTDGWATPGATLPGAALDLARTAARRAERRLVSVGAVGRILRPVVGHYVNRLSDLLWLMARDAGRPATAQQKH